MDAVSTMPGRRRPALLRRARSGDVSTRSDDAGNGARSGEPLRIAMLAPPWIPIPSPGYGGVESVVSTLTEALVHRGHGSTDLEADLGDGSGT